MFASIPISAIEDNVNKWGNTLVGYVMGNRPFYSHLKACVGRLWRTTCSLEIHSRENGFFFFKFGTKEECDRVLNEGPWLFDGRLIILKPWSPTIGLERDILTTVPVWVRFPSLHLKLWSRTVISYMASIIGKPLYMDNATATGERLEFARCFIEIEASAKLPKSVRLDLGNGDWYESPVQFEWVPPRCSKCKTFGHNDIHCPHLSDATDNISLVDKVSKGNEGHNSEIPVNAATIGERVCSTFISHNNVMGSGLHQPESDGSKAKDTADTVIADTTTTAATIDTTDTVIDTTDTINEDTTDTVTADTNGKLFTGTTPLLSTSDKCDPMDTAIGMTCNTTEDQVSEDQVLHGMGQVSEQISDKGSENDLIVSEQLNQPAMEPDTHIHALDDVDFPITEINPEWIMEKEKVAKVALKSKTSTSIEQVHSLGPKRSTRSNKGNPTRH